MEKHLEIQINFSDDNKASINLSTDEPQEKNNELIAFSHYALRQIFNLGCDETSAQLASYLIEISEDITEFIDLTDPDEPLLTNVIDEKRKFIIKFNIGENIIHSHLKAKGFGILGRGLGYYGPISVIILLRYFCEKNSKDENYLNSLAKVCEYTGRLFFDRKVEVIDLASEPLLIVEKAVS